MQYADHLALAGEDVLIIAHADNYKYQLYRQFRELMTGLAGDGFYLKLAYEEGGRVWFESCRTLNRQGFDWHRMKCRMHPTFRCLADHHVWATRAYRDER